MRASSSAKNAVCAYCGEYGPTSRDHVPPKNLFPKPRTADLITVPACESCHSGSSKDDDYFRAALLTSEFLEGNAEAERAIDELMRSLGGRKGRGFIGLLASSIEKVDLWSPQGSIYLGKRDAFRIDRQRITAVLSRIIRGLYFHELGQPVPTNYQVVAELQPQVNSKLIEMVASISFTSPPKVVGEGVFEYFFQRVDEDPNSILWVLHFYGCFPAIGFVLLPKDQRNQLLARDEVVEGPENNHE
jgi:hypothetical protein